MEGKQAYRGLDGSADVPLWQQPWWLDAVAPGRWDAVALTKGGRVVAALPYVPARKWGVERWLQPPMSQSLGPWLEPRQGKLVNRLAWENEMLAALVQEIPAKVAYRQSWGVSRGNWLPFYWSGYSQQTRYTYRLDLSLGADVVWREMSEQTRKAIRKAEGRYGVTVEEQSDLNAFLPLNDAVFARQELPQPYSHRQIEAVFDAARARDAARVFIAREADGTPSAGALIVRDETTSYYLVGGSDPELRHSGAQTLVLWAAIRRALDDSAIFDFEGSMIEGIERSFRSFGAEQVPYLSVFGSRDPWTRRVLALRSLA